MLPATRRSRSPSSLSSTSPPPAECSPFNPTGSLKRDQGISSSYDDLEDLGTEYFSCSECTCFSSGTYYTCPECQDLEGLFSEPASLELLDILTLDDVTDAKRRQRSRSLPRSFSRSRSRSRGRTRSRSVERMPLRVYQERNSSRSLSRHKSKHRKEAEEESYEFLGPPDVTVTATQVAEKIDSRPDTRDQSSVVKLTAESELSVAEQGNPAVSHAFPDVLEWANASDSTTPHDLLLIHPVHGITIQLSDENNGADFTLVSDYGSLSTTADSYGSLQPQFDDSSNSPNTHGYRQDLLATDVSSDLAKPFSCQAPQFEEEFDPSLLETKHPGPVSASNPDDYSSFDMEDQEAATTELISIDDTTALAKTDKLISIQSTTEEASSFADVKEGKALVPETDSYNKTDSKPTNAGTFPSHVSDYSNLTPRPYDHKMPSLDQSLTAKLRSKDTFCTSDSSVPLEESKPDDNVALEEVKPAEDKRVEDRKAEGSEDIRWIPVPHWTSREADGSTGARTKTTSQSYPFHDVSSERITTRVVLHSGGSSGTRVLTLEQRRAKSDAGEVGEDKRRETVRWDAAAAAASAPPKGSSTCVSASNINSNVASVESFIFSPSSGSSDSASSFITATQNLPINTVQTCSSDALNVATQLIAESVLESAFTDLSRHLARYETVHNVETHAHEKLVTASEKAQQATGKNTDNLWYGDNITKGELSWCTATPVVKDDQEEANKLQDSRWSEPTALASQLQETSRSLTHIAKQLLVGVQARPSSPEPWESPVRNMFPPPRPEPPNEDDDWEPTPPRPKSPEMYREVEEFSSEDESEHHTVINLSHPRYEIYYPFRRPLPTIPEFSPPPQEEEEDAIPAFPADHSTTELPVDSEQSLPHTKSEVQQSSIPMELRNSSLTNQLTPSTIEGEPQIGTSCSVVNAPLASLPVHSSALTALKCITAQTDIPITGPSVSNRSPDPSEPHLLKEEDLPFQYQETYDYNTSATELRLSPLDSVLMELETITEQRRPYKSEIQKAATALPTGNLTDHADLNGTQLLVEMKEGTCGVGGGETEAQGDHCLGDMSEAAASASSPTPRLSDGESAGAPNRPSSAASGAVSRVSGATSVTGLPTTTLSTIAVQSGTTRIVLALLQSADWLELKVVELTPGLVYLGSTLEEAVALQKAHHEVLVKLQSKQSPVEDLLNQADQLICTQRPRAEVYAAMAESLGLAWKNVNLQLESRKELLDMSVSFHTRARQYSDALDAAERTYTDNVMPSEAEGAREMLSALHDHKRAILEASMFTLQEAHIILARLRGLLQDGGTVDSRPQHIRTNIEFACSQIEHLLETLHDRRRFLDGLFTSRKIHLEQCLTLCLLYQDLASAVMAMKRLRDEISDHQSLGDSQASAEILLHEHLRREAEAKGLQDQCVKYVKAAEQMVTNGHYAGSEARARAYSVLEAATALHETCDTRTGLLQQAGLFFKLAQGALTKLDQAEVQVAGLAAAGGGQRFSVVMGVVEEALQPALNEGYGILEVTGGKGQAHNQGVTAMVEELERRRLKLMGVCAATTEQVLQKTELVNSFLEQYNSIESWLVRIGDAFLQGHQDPGGSLSLAKDFLHLHVTLKRDITDKKQDIDALVKFLNDMSSDLTPEELESHKEKLLMLEEHWDALSRVIDSRITICEMYLKFHLDAEDLLNMFEELESLLKKAVTEEEGAYIEAKWANIQRAFLALEILGNEFVKEAKETTDPYLDSNRAILCVKSILEHLGKRRLVVTDLQTHLQMKISTTKQLSDLFCRYKDSLLKMEKEVKQLEEQDLCPLLQGDANNPEALGASLEARTANFVGTVKKIQEDIENMVTHAEVAAYKEMSDERHDVIKSLLHLYQYIQNKATDYQILSTMLVHWCRNIAEIHRSCDKLENQFGAASDIGGVEGQIREHEAARQAINELLNFAHNEAESIIQKIRVQCPREAGARDIAKMNEMLQRRKTILEEVWTHRQAQLEKQLRRSQYHVDLQVISDQLRDLSDQLAKMRGHYGDSLNTALRMRNSFSQFQATVQLLQKRIQNFVTTADRMVAAEDDSGEIKIELAELEKKWSTFQTQVGQSQKSIELSIDFFKLVQEAEDWFKEGSRLLVSVSGESSHARTPEEASHLRQKIESFICPGEQENANRIRKISSLAIELYGDTSPQQVEAITQQNRDMLQSFETVDRNLQELIDNLRMAEQHRYQQEKEQQELAASLAAAQAEADAARLAAAAAEEARKAAEDVALKMSIPVEPVLPEKVEVDIQTEAIESPPPTKKFKITEEEPQFVVPFFVTPLVGATVTEGVRFIFECRVTGFPVPQVEWLKDGIYIKENSDYRTHFENGVCTLTIEETLTEDSAIFTCRASNTFSYAETSAQLVVKEPPPAEVMAAPVFTSRLEDATVVEGSTFQLESTVTGHPLPVVTWSKNDTCIDESSNYVITYNNGQCVLRFEEVFLEDDAEYSCKATNEFGEDVTKAKITVTATEMSEVPKFPVPLSNIMARAGQKFKLECQITGTPTPTVAWFHNGKPLKETPDCKVTFDGRTTSLVVSEAFPKHAGIYSVVAKNTAGEGQTSSNVSVKGRIPTETSDSELTSDIDAEPVKPTVQSGLKDVTIHEGASVRLDCVIVGQPEPEVIWYHGDKPVKESEDFKLLFHGDRCSLVIQEAFAEDAGVYRVVAVNSAGEASTSCMLTVQAPEAAVQPPPEPEQPCQPVAEAPKFLNLLVDNHVPEGQPVTLSVQYHGTPSPTIAWFRDGMPLLPDSQLQIHEEGNAVAKVIIPHAGLDHTGQYEVVASNSVGTAKCLCFLSIEPHLPLPKPVEPSTPPVFTKLIEDITASTGQDVTFEAELCGIPIPTIRWTINDSPVTGQEYQRGHKLYDVVEGRSGDQTWCRLHIPSASLLTAGRVCVKAENEAGMAVSSATFKVLDFGPPLAAPSPFESFESKTFISESKVSRVITTDFSGVPTEDAYEATSVTHVRTAAGEPTVQVQGTQVQELHRERDAVPEIKREVTIIKAAGDQALEEVTDVPSPTVARKVVKKKVIPARFITPLQGCISQENERAVLECVIDGHPPPTITWSHNGNPLPATVLPSLELNKVQLTFAKVGKDHAGRYTCAIENQAGYAECTCDVVVKKTVFPPVFSRRLQPTVVGVQERLHLEVDVTGTPTPDITWTKDGQVIASNQRTEIKSEGTRHYLVIPTAEEGDSGRYGVAASNSAGRAENLADVAVTKLLVDLPPAAQRVQFTEVTDDARNLNIVEEGHVKSLKRAIEESSEEALAPVFPHKTPKTSVQLSAKPVIGEIAAHEPEVVRPSQLSVEEKPAPGKLRKSWPPPPEEEEQVTRMEPVFDVTKNKVSSIISSFTELSETSQTTSEDKIIKSLQKQVKPFSFPDKKSAENETHPEISLVPEPQPEYCVVEYAEEPQDVLPHQPEAQLPFHKHFTRVEELVSEPIPDFEALLKPLTPIPEAENEKTQTPETPLGESAKDDLESEECSISTTDGLFTPLLSETFSKYPTTTSETTSEIKYEKYVKEATYTEIKKSYSETEQTSIETKIYREEIPEGKTPEEHSLTPDSIFHLEPEEQEEVTTDTEPSLLMTGDSVEHERYYESDIQDAVMEDAIMNQPIPVVSQEFPLEPIDESPLEKVSEEDKSLDMVEESPATFVSSSQVETKIFSLEAAYEEQKRQELSKARAPQERDLSSTSPAQHEISDITSSDEIKPTASESKETLKQKKKRESVRQIALRLEETIIPVSPDEVPGGVRMFPAPKTATPIKEPPPPFKPTTPKEQLILKELGQQQARQEKPLSSSLPTYPELQPFPFQVEQGPVVQRVKGPPPPKPKKFIPGAFSDNEYESDADAPLGEIFIPKKIKFDIQAKPSSRCQSLERKQLPPSAFEIKPLESLGMRPDVLHVGEKNEKPKKTIEMPPRKLSKAAKKFVAHVLPEKDITLLGKPSKQNDPVIKEKTNSLMQDNQEKEVKLLAKPTKLKDSAIKQKISSLLQENLEIDKESDVILDYGMRKPHKLGVVWPPPQEPEDPHPSQRFSSPSLDAWDMSTVDTIQSTSFMQESFTKEEKHTSTIEKVVATHSAFHSTDHIPGKVAVSAIPTASQETFIIQTPPEIRHSTETDNSLHQKSQHEPLAQEIHLLPQHDAQEVHLVVEHRIPAHVAEDSYACQDVQLMEPHPVHLTLAEESTCISTVSPQESILQTAVTDVVTDGSIMFHEEEDLDKSSAMNYKEESKKLESVLKESSVHVLAGNVYDVNEYMDTLPDAVQQSTEIPHGDYLQKTIADAPEQQIFNGQSAKAASFPPGFKPVRAPAAVPKQHPTQRQTVTPIPPFEMKCPEVGHLPVVTGTLKTKPSIEHQEAAVEAEILQEESKMTFTEKTQKTAYLATSSKKSAKSFVVKKAPSRQWPPPKPEVVQEKPSFTVRSHSLERPRVSKAINLPPTSLEAPPNIYWTSNISLKEKEAKWETSSPLTQVTSTCSHQSSILAVTQQESVVEQNHLVRTQTERDFTTERHAKTSEPDMLKEFPKIPQVLVRRPAPMSSRTTDFRASVPPSFPHVTKEAKKRQEPFVIGYKPIPEPEPFPFEAPKIKPPKPRGPPPAFPKKFVAGTFTESDYESDLEGRPSPLWKGYMSDSEIPSYKPVHIHLKPGRHKTTKHPSPPPPSKFDVPSKVILPLKSAVSWSDFESDIPTSKETTPVPEFRSRSLPRQPCKVLIPSGIPIIEKTTGKSHRSSVHRNSSLSQLQTIQLEAQPSSYGDRPKQGVAAVRKMFESQPVKPTPLFKIPKYKASRSLTSLELVSHPPAETKVFTLADSSSPLQRKESKQQSTSQPDLTSEVLSQVARSYQQYADDSVSGEHKNIDNTVSFPESFSGIVQKPSSPKTKKKEIHLTKTEMEESGYIADTEGTLPRKSGKSQAVYESAGGVSKKETSSSSTFKSESRSCQVSSAFSQLSSLTRGGLSSTGGGGASEFPSTNGIPPGSFTYQSSSPTTETKFTSSYSSTQSKSSQVKSVWFLSR